MKKIILVFIISYFVTKNFFLAVILSIISYFLFNRNVIDDFQKINVNFNNKIPFTSNIFPDVKDVRTFFVKSVFATMGNISKSKGKVLDSDINLATEYMNQLNVRDELRKECQDAFSMGKDASFPLRNLLKEFYKLFANNKRILSLFLDIQLNIAYSDGLLHDNEKRILLLIVNEFGFTINYLEQKIRFYENTYKFNNTYQEYYNREYQRHYENNSNYSNNSYKQKEYSQSYSNQELLVDAYKVLGVKSSDDHATVKAAYRKLMNQYHPDKFAARKVPEEFHEVYREKAKQIVNSYKLICEYKNWK